MPLYEYRCTECGNEFEKVVRFSEADQEQPCPSCQGHNTRKKISTFAAIGISSGSQAGGSSASNCNSGGRFT